MVTVQRAMTVNENKHNKNVHLNTSHLIVAYFPLVLTEICDSLKERHVN